MDTLKVTKGSPSRYYQIKEIYREKILNGEYKRGQKIPSEIEIQKIFDVSRITARQAILELEKEGMVKRGRGKGTFVIWQPGIEEELSHIMSFTEEMRTRGRTPGTANISVNLVPITEEIAEKLHMEKNQNVYCIKRVRTADDIKIVYFVSYFPLSTNLPLDASKYDQSIYAMLDYSETGMPVHVQEKISTMLPDEETQAALKISKKQPVLVRERVSYNEKGELIEFTTCYYRGDLYTYTISTTQAAK
ncbi:MAG: GntR family transcriptional regulator [Holdemanella sp.]|nr:GntR family transcriptional regulator [Holdemanella sp.]